MSCIYLSPDFIFRDTRIEECIILSLPKNWFILQLMGIHWFVRSSFDWKIESFNRRIVEVWIWMISCNIVFCTLFYWNECTSYIHQNASWNFDFFLFLRESWMDLKQHLNFTFYRLDPFVVIQSHWMSCDRAKPRHMTFRALCITYYFIDIFFETNFWEILVPPKRWFCSITASAMVLLIWHGIIGR